MEYIDIMKEELLAEKIFRFVEYTIFFRYYITHEEEIL